MSVENVGKFYYQVLQKNPQLIEQMKKADNPESFIQETVTLGHANGYAFTPRDVAAFVTQQKLGALSEQELTLAEAPCPANTKFTVCVLVSGCWASIC